MTSWDFPPYPQAALSESVLNFTIINFIGQSICHEGVKKQPFFWKRKSADENKGILRAFTTFTFSTHYKNELFFMRKSYKTFPVSIQYSPFKSSTFACSLFNFQPSTIQLLADESSILTKPFLNDGRFLHKFLLYIRFFVLHASWFEKQNCKE